MSIDKAVDSTQLDSDLTSVANAIRTKGGTSAQLAFPNGFVSAIGDIPTGGTLITKTITENGTYSAEDDDADGYSEVTVNVPSGGKIETGTFTIATDTKRVTINHSLGVAPNYCFVYPINVPKATEKYRIGWEAIINNVGQQDWNISSRDETFGANHGMWQGTSYALDAKTSSAFHNIGAKDAGSATASTFIVGALSDTGSGGTLSAGTFGYILGVIE